MTVASNANATFNVDSLKNAPAGQGINGGGIDGATGTFNTDSDVDVSGTYKNASNVSYTVVGADGTTNQFIVSRRNRARWA